MQSTDVQISTGVSQWDLPTSEAPVGGGSHHGTPAQAANPYHKPDGAEGPEAGTGTRGIDGPTGDRAGGLGVGTQRLGINEAGLTIALGICSQRASWGRQTE